MVLETVELCTLGVILRFAIELERQAGEFYRISISRVHDPSTTELFSRYSREYARRLKLLEGLHQLSINEVLLEPISNMESTKYAFSAVINNETGIDPVETALNVETKVRAFYGDAVREAGSVLGEASRVFKRLQEENMGRQKTLLSLRDMY